MAKSKKGKAVIAGVAAVSAASILTVRGIFHKVFARQEKEDDAISLRYKDMSGMVRKKITIVSGSTHLTGYLYGEASAKGLVVVCHGIAGGGEDNLSMVKYMLDDGYQVFTFDYTGVYESEGASSVGFYQAVKDLNAVLGYIEASASLKNLPVFLYGHSWGGYTAAAVLNFKHNIAGVITISGFSSPMAITKEAAGRIIPTLLVDLLLPFAAIYQRIVFGKNYNLSAIDGINSCDVPVLVMHGKEDEVISYEGSSIIAQRSHITNPNVEYYTETRPGKSNHMGIFFTKGGTAYYLAKKEELKMLHDLYYNRVPEKVLSKWFARLDKKQANDMDPLFVKTVLDFLDKHCK